MVCVALCTAECAGLADRAFVLWPTLAGGRTFRAVDLLWAQATFG